jgi:hypothetical protein
MPDQPEENEAQLLQRLAIRPSKVNAGMIRSHLERTNRTIVVIESRDTIRNRHMKRLKQLGFEKHKHVEPALHTQQVDYLLRKPSRKIELLITAEDVALTGDDFQARFETQERKQAQSSCIDLVEVAEDHGIPFLLADEKRQDLQHPKIISEGRYTRNDLIKIMMALGIYS